VKILFLGDVYGPPGRRALKTQLPGLKERLGVDVTVVNGENAADGFGISPVHVTELVAAGADLITTGDHAFDKRELMPALATEPRVLRPANYPEGAPGRGSAILDTRGGKRLAVLNLQGRVFMPPTDDPFRVADVELERIPKHIKVIFVDMHGEATSEKVAMGWYLDGRVSAVVGTHTHIPTADETILPGGTAFQTDVGMAGPFHSVIGVVKEDVIRRFLTSIPDKFESASQDAHLNAVFVEVDSQTGKAIRIERIRRR